MQLPIVVVLALAVARPIGSSSRPYESGECEKLFSYTASRYAPYQETYRVRKWGIFYETKVRWNYKREFYTAYGKKKVCCADYRTTDTGDCEPICDPDCVNGECIAPDACRCFDGYTRSETRNTVCEPICSDCVHGTCQLPNVCVCDHGYRMNKNGTVCEPICDVDCETMHARCSAPGVCTCQAGYASFDDNKCVPVCEAECVNGDCVEPNVCGCREGYEPDPRDRFSCVARCKNGCLFGTCASPNNCTCEPGYRLDETARPNLCEPICSEPCTMGTCVAPEICSCDRGYGLLGRSKYVCEPICERACLNGTCTAPDVCACHRGYRLADDEANERVCVPHCRIPCQPYGLCTAPDTCTCFDGYRIAREQPDSPQSRYFASTSACEPICEQNCGNGSCIAPNACTCYDGYENDENGSCVPSCDRCENGSCVAPGICECDPGYAATNAANRTVCEPSCERCTNGRCVAPDDCRCDHGFLKEPIDAPGNDTIFDCVAACAANCSEHGSCDIFDRTCDCYYGWHGPDCEQPIFCVLRIDRGNLRSNASRIVYRANRTIDIDRAFAGSPLCNYSIRFDEIANETLCYDEYDDNEGNYAIACLIGAGSDGRGTVVAEYTRKSSYVIPIGIAGLTTISTAGVAAIYLIGRARGKRRYSLDD